MNAVADKKRRPKSVPNPWPKKLRALRAKLGVGGKLLPQAQAAARVRISVRAWIKWEQGDQIPSPAHQLLIELLASEKI